MFCVSVDGSVFVWLPESEFFGRPLRKCANSLLVDSEGRWLVGCCSVVSASVCIGRNLEKSGGVLKSGSEICFCLVLVAGICCAVSCVCCVEVCGVLCGGANVGPPLLCIQSSHLVVRSRFKCEIIDTQII